ncbi:TIGR03619 family F420-dependent LLM class oxidoreductase [Kribbella shirazensis]|uniref:Putative F420-dependent oxidoreductase n=1 Tax=Kribbella shirazensis TaxID=1105143 RepID=A0A7X5VCV1_9ACTN|nr:TIGR03619 family F420-dependent LLM class oxidoreductase [Kribbella shirazensis]NIK58885.1 putative F420-dependent oxidoreductase [Kribbella shirazensis]
MKLGLGLPTSGVGTSVAAIAEAAEEAERIGLDSIWTFERLLSPVDGAIGIGGTEPTPLPESYRSVYDPLETLAYVAARTSTIALGTSVLDVLLHSPIVLGRRLATLDQLCGGRLLAGLGVGWMVAEFDAAGVPTERRGARLEEHITAMRAVWGPDPVAHDGAFYTIAPSYAGPKPVAPGGVAVLAGAMAPAAVERAGRLGLGLNPIMMTWEMFEGSVAAFRDAAAKAGHDAASLPVVVRVNGEVTASPVDDRQPLTGSVEQVVEDLARVARSGVDHVLWGPGDDVDQQLELMAELRRSI